MEAKLGGSVWHCSVSSPDPVTEYDLLKLCEKHLSGVGDKSLGEWVQATRKPDSLVVHLRRRTTPQEEVVIGPLKDIRNTQEARIRVARLLARVPPNVRQYISPEW